MKIKDSENLKFPTHPAEMDEDHEPMNPAMCILDTSSRSNGTLTLIFKNKAEAEIKAKNDAGGGELQAIESKINGLVGKSYEEILNFNF